VAAAGGGEVSAGAGSVVPEAARRPLRELMDGRLLDALLERSRDQAGGLRLTGEGSMLGELVRAVLERALEPELTAHLGSMLTNVVAFDPAVLFVQVVGIEADQLRTDGDRPSAGLGPGPVRVVPRHNADLGLGGGDVLMAQARASSARQPLSCSRAKKKWSINLRSSLTSSAVPTSRWDSRTIRVPALARLWP
jgi:hypothetical protein